MILAIATHKYVIAFCVGLELFVANTRKSLFVIYILAFSLMSPIGIGIGMAIIHSLADDPQVYYISVGVLQALSAGTILYVVVFQVLQRERSKNVSGNMQLFCFILGFCAMMLVEIFGMLLILSNYMCFQ